MRLHLLVLLAIVIPTAKADSPATPFAFVTAAPEGRFFLSMAPPLSKEPDWHIILRKPYAALFEPQDDGSFKEIWRIDNFYSFRVFLTWDGRHMVALGPWNSGNKTNSKDIALSFFTDGKLSRIYSTADLLDDPHAVKASTSHYQWRDETDRSYPRLHAYLFEIKTVEGYVCSFSMEGEFNGKEKNP